MTSQDLWYPQTSLPRGALASPAARLVAVRWVAVDILSGFVLKMDPLAEVRLLSREKPIPQNHPIKGPHRVIFGRWTPMGRGEAPLSISPSSTLTIDISKHTPIYMHTVATEPTFQESSLAQKSYKSPGLDLFSMDTQAGCRVYLFQNLYFLNHLVFLTLLSLALLC